MTVTTIRPDGITATGDEIVREPMIRTRQQVSRAALLAERGSILKAQRRMEDEFLRHPTQVLALKLALSRERLSDLELAVVGVVLNG